MLNIDEIRARAKRAIREEFPDGPVEGSASYYCVTGDIPDLCDEVERLQSDCNNIETERDVLKRVLETVADTWRKTMCLQRSNTLPTTRRRKQAMGKFDFMGFGADDCSTDMFVASAKKYSAEQTVSLCKREYSYLFEPSGEYRLREPTVDDVQEAGCAFRFGNPEWPDGCYTLVGDGETGSFPVHVIDFQKLREEEAK